MPRERFLEMLSGVEDPETKRKIIGEQFIRVFEREADKAGPFDFLAQGTLYPDVIESTTKDTKAAVKIKTHHNVGGLPDDMQFQLIEPLKWLFKDEVRNVGRALGLPDEIVERQPFPGPGLAVRTDRRGDRRRTWSCCAGPTRSSARKSRRPGWRRMSGSTSRC